MSSSNPNFAIPGLGIPVRNIFCIGRNYAEHARELNNPLPSEPVVFLKPTSSLCLSGSEIRLPAQSQQVDHEVEIVVAIGAKASHVSEEDALRHVAGYGIGIDLTARDLQEKAKQKALPWAIAKGFDTFAPVGGFVRASQLQDPSGLGFDLEVNGNMRQTGRASDMIFSIPKLISFLSGIFTLEAGDLIFTGTPSGVSALKPGDRVRCQLGNGLSTLELTVRQA